VKDPVQRFIHEATNMAACVGVYLQFMEPDSLIDQKTDIRLAMAKEDSFVTMKIAYERFRALTKELAGASDAKG
jgi:hypothetical protein